MSLPLSPHPCEPLLSVPSTDELTAYTSLELSPNGRALLVTGERQHSQRLREATGVSLYPCCCLSISFCLSLLLSLCLCLSLFLSPQVASPLCLLFQAVSPPLDARCCPFCYAVSLSLTLTVSFSAAAAAAAGLLSHPVCELWDLHDTSYRAHMSVWGSSWDRLRPYPIPKGKRRRRETAKKPSALFALPDCLFPQILAVQTSCSSNCNDSSSSSSRPYRVFLNQAFLEETEEEGEDAAETIPQMEGEIAAAPKKPPEEGDKGAVVAAATGGPAAAEAAAAAAAVDEEEALVEWARNEASTFEGPLGGDIRCPARAFCCRLWRDKVLGVGGPAHLGAALQIWDAASGKRETDVSSLFAALCGISADGWADRIECDRGRDRQGYR